MAIASVKEKTTLKLELDAGTVNGKQKVKSKSFNNVKTDATDESLHEVATTLAGLQQNDLLNVKRVEETLLTEE